jgi:tRNA nucleotidyltransferase (CCA-adding enzyme)
MLLKRFKDLPEEMARFIHLAGVLADKKGVSVYVVGGFVRDLLLGVNNFDIDLVIGGDGIIFATDLAARLKLRLVTHRRFGTATLHGLTGFKVDIASARKEIYEKPAALPIVFNGTIEDDLFRRDFTINAMAISINKTTFGQLVDFYDGHSDLKMGIVRALHQNSFIDDPTRILRAVRFEQRFDFKIEKNTLHGIDDAQHAKMLHHVHKHRLRDELVLIFKEKTPFKSLKRLHELCGFSYIAGELRFKKNDAHLYEEVLKKISWFREQFNYRRHLESYTMYMCLFFHALALSVLENVIGDFAFHKGESSRMISLKKNLKVMDEGLAKKNMKPSEVYRILEPLSYEVILLGAILSKSVHVAQRVEDFLLHYNGQRPHIKGEDLKVLGVKPGPRFKSILEKLLFAKIDGDVKNKEEESALVQRLLM